MRPLAAVGLALVVGISSGAAPPQDRPGKGNGRAPASTGATTTTTTTAATATAESTTTTTTGPPTATTAMANGAGRAKQVKAASAHGLSITTITWDVIGLDSTDVNDGPNVYPVGVRVCATGGAVEAITVTFTWLSANPYLNLVGTGTQTITSLAAGQCADRYFFVAVTRDGAAYDTTRSYSVTATAADGTTATTPTPRQLYVERLLSQNRNTVMGISGPTTVYEGDTVVYTIEAETAPNGYQQIDTFLTMLQPMFSLTDVFLTYSAPAGTTTRSPYADACGWDPDPTSPTYRSCLGTGRIGGTVTGTFTGTVVGLGTTSMSTAIIDVSGSSYHYNSDFGTAPNLIVVTALPSADLALAKVAVGEFVAGGIGRYRLTVTNAGPSTSPTPVTITDALPAGMTLLQASGTGWSCTGTASVTCTGNVAIAPGSSSTVTVTVAVPADAAGSVTNTATVTGLARDLDLSDNTDTATVDVVTAEEAAEDGEVGEGVRSSDHGSTRPSRGAGGTRGALAATGAGDAGPLAAFGVLLVGAGLGARRAGLGPRGRRPSPA